MPRSLSCNSYRLTPIDLKGHCVEQCLENLKKSLPFNNNKVLSLEIVQSESLYGISGAEEKYSNEEVKLLVSRKVQ